MSKQPDSDLWAMAVKSAQAGEDVTKAFRAIRTAGGRDLVKSEEDFGRVYTRFATQPLFASHFVLTMQRSEFQADMMDAALRLTPDSIEHADEIMATLQDFEKGSGEAMFTILDLVDRPDLETRSKALWPRIHKSKEQHAIASATSRAQLELPFAPVGERDPVVPVVPA